MALDNVLIAQVISILNAGFTALATQVPIAPIVKQSFQPTQQGADSAPTIYLYKIGDNRLGHPLRSNVWDTVNLVENYTETQQYETTFQLSAWVTQSPSSTTGLTASDYINYAAYIMQSLSTVATLEANGIGIYRVGQVRNPSFSNDFDRFQFSPSFDFTLTHKQVIQILTPIISETILQVETV